MAIGDDHLVARNAEYEAASVANALVDLSPSKASTASIGIAQTPARPAIFARRAHVDIAPAAFTPGRTGITGARPPGRTRPGVTCAVRA
jgi:hypothetical protein